MRCASLLETVKEKSAIAVLPGGPHQQERNNETHLFGLHQARNIVSFRQQCMIFWNSHCCRKLTIGVRIDGEKGLAWTNVTLGKLLDDGGKTVYLGRKWGGNSLVNITLGKLSSKLLSIPLVGRVIGELSVGGYPLSSWPPKAHPSTG